MGANAVTTVYDFTAGQVLTAAQMDNVNCGIPVFATTVTRDAAFGGTGEKTLAEGQMAYIETGDLMQYYNGSAWIPIGNTIQQVQYYESSTQVQFTSTTYVDITGYSITITPRSTSSLIRIDIALNTRPQTANTTCKFQVLRTSTSTMILQSMAPGGADYFQQIAGTWIDNPATTSAVTYKIQGNTASGTQTINSGGAATSSFVLTEYLP
jgi:hypothetical protein